MTKREIYMIARENVVAKITELRKANNYGYIQGETIEYMEKLDAIDEILENRPDTDMDEEIKY